MQFLVALVGLGVAIDYSLLVVSRWREERAHGRSGDEAVQRAMETAGRAVVFSGITVAIGLLALIALPLPFLRSMGYGGMLIPLVSTLVAITLLPVDPGEGRSAARLAAPAHRRQGEPRLDALGRAVSRRRWVAAGAGIAVILALALAATNLQLGASDANTIAKKGDAEQGLKALEGAGIGEGSILPHEILVGGNTNPQRSPATEPRPGHPRCGRAERTGVEPRRDSHRRGDPGPGQRHERGSRHARRACATRPTPPVRTSGSAAVRPRTRTSSTPSTGASR